MRRWVLLVLLLAGCTASPTPGDEAPAGMDEPTAPVLQADAFDLRPYADADAKAWNPAAKLILVAAFEGQIPFNEPLVPVGPSDPWVGPFRDQPGDLGDGRSRVWSFSYTVDDEVSQAAMDVCQQGVHAEVRMAHVVTVDETGTIVASYDTQDDDEGSATTGFLPEGLISSAQAASNAESELRLPRSTATYGRTFLMSEWYFDQPVWAFQLENADERWIVAVDAMTGAVLDLPAGPRC